MYINGQVDLPTNKDEFVYNLLASSLPACIATGVSSGLPSKISPIAYILDTLVCSASLAITKPFL